MTSSPFLELPRLELEEYLDWPAATAGGVLTC